MKTLAATLATLALLTAARPAAMAGDREWATAGKILTGVVAGAALAKAFEPAPVYRATTYYAPPVVCAPAPVVVQPTATVVYSAPVIYSTPPPVVYATPAPVVYTTPVVVQSAPVFIRPAPVVRFHVGFGRRHCAPPVYRVCR